MGPLTNEIFERVAVDPQVVPPASKLFSFDVDAGGQSRRLHGVIGVVLQSFMLRQMEEFL